MPLSVCAARYVKGEGTGPLILVTSKELEQSNTKAKANVKSIQLKIILTTSAVMDT